MSSTIWNARPSSRAVRARPRAIVASVAPAMTAPATADARISAPVLRACIARSAVAVERRRAGRRPPARSIAWPPTMPARAGGVGDDARSPAACAGQRAGRSPCVGRLARQQRERLGQQRRRRRGSPCPRRSTTWRSAGRAAACRRPSPAGRREPASRCESARARTRPAAPARSAASASRPMAVRRRFGRGEHEHRPQPLAAGEQAVAHRLGDERRARGRRGEEALERRVDLARAARRASVERGDGALTASASSGVERRATPARA